MAGSHGSSTRQSRLRMGRRHKATPATAQYQCHHIYLAGKWLIDPPQHCGVVDILRGHRRPSRGSRSRAPLARPPAAHGPTGPADRHARGKPALAWRLSSLPHRQRCPARAHRTPPPTGPSPNRRHLEPLRPRRPRPVTNHSQPDRIPTTEKRSLPVRNPWMRGRRCVAAPPKGPPPRGAQFSAPPKS